MKLTINPIKASDKLQSLFERDERLIDVMATQSPQLAKLRNSPIRHIMARITTVAQAARLCNMPTDSLLRQLNGVLGIAMPPDDMSDSNEVSNRAEDSSQLPSFTSAVELDVREELSKGGEPFSRIMAAIAALGDDQVLHLRAPFEPVPLFSVLEKRGFGHNVEQHAADDWSVWFFRQNRLSAHERVPAQTQTPRSTDGPADGSAEPNNDVADDGAARPEVWLDVRDLEPPEPLVRTLEALESLSADAVLVQVNMRVPQFLLPILRERGFHFTIDESQLNEVQVRIWRNA
jgi:hypothetical protein